MDSASDDVARASSRPQVRYGPPHCGGTIPSAVPHQATGCGVLENSSNVMETCCFTEYYEVMSPGLDNLGMGSAGASSSTLICNIGEAASGISAPCLQIENLQILPYKNSAGAGSIGNPHIQCTLDLNMSSNLGKATQFTEKVSDCVPTAAGRLTIAEPSFPAENRPVECHADSQSKCLKAFKQELVELVKLIMYSKWKEGLLSKKVYKEIAMKVTKKVVESIPVSKFPDTPKKIEAYLACSEQRIKNFVQQYLKLYETKGSRP